MNCLTDDKNSFMNNYSFTILKSYDRLRKVDKIKKMKEEV